VIGVSQLFQVALTIGIVIPAGHRGCLGLGFGTSGNPDRNGAGVLHREAERRRHTSPGGDELRIVLHNPSAGEGGDALFNVNEIYFNAASGVTALTLLSATHSVNGDVFAAWQPVETAAAADGFGIFDYALTDGVGEMNPAIAMPGQSVTFLFDIAGTGPFDMNDFIEANAMGYTAAAKFVNGPDDPEDPGMEDSAFGAVPEPGTALLLSLGLVALGVRRR
jgi:hypothetical protein